MPVEIGIAQLTRMGMVPVPSTADEPESGYRVWADRTRESLPDWDGLYVHLKGPDVFGHDGDAEGKRHNIEQIDRFYFGPLMELLDPDHYLVAVTADHSTPCAIKAHSDDPVPLLISGGTLEPEGSLQFGEGESSRGRLGRMRGTELVPRLVELAR
jgi:2,3-bisphosphoglycerate-independent phosphoglycerate mutase